MKLQVLQKVREHLSDEKHWTKYDDARTAEGDCCLPNDPLARSWCLYGACTLQASNWIERAGAMDEISSSIQRLYPDLMKDQPEDDLIAIFNDLPDTTIEDIHRVLDDAITRSRRKA